MSKQHSLFAVVASVAFLLAGCAHNTDIKAEGAAFNWSNDQKRILVVKPDIMLGELTAGGLVEPRADWTKAAEGFVATRLSAFMAKRNVTVVDAGDLSDPHDVQLIKLHGAVGQAILLHAIGGIKLPNKKNALDWSLGPGTDLLRQRFGTDYALFIHVEDSYTSAGRAALQAGGVAACVLTGGAVCIIASGGNQLAFASLVDLKTGNIVWFNLRSDESGDLRDDKGAVTFVEGLLKDMPL